MPSFSYDAEGVTPLETGVIPAGTYAVAIGDIKEKTNKHGLPSFGIQCFVDEGSYAGRSFWHNVHLLPKDNKGAGIAIHFLKSIGQPWEGKFNITPEDWVGHRFIANVKIGNDQTGNPRNEIAGLIPVSVGSPIMNTKLQMKYQQKKLDSGDVPF